MTARPESSGGPAPTAVLVAAGWGCIVLGGLVAAGTGPLGLTHGSWLAAYLVLVGGVAQVAMATARTWHRDGVQPAAGAMGQVVAWNGGNIAVMGGTLAGEPPLVELGSVLLVVAIVIALHADRTQNGALCSGGQVARLVRWAYRGLLVVLLVSIPVGIVLSYVRHD